jgi:dUTP pyrophosphatase
MQSQTLIEHMNGGQSMDLKIKLLDKKCMPYKKYATDAGIDLKARLNKLVSVSQFTTETIPTGVCVDIPEGYVGLITPRSSMNKIGVSSEIGTIDEGYTGEIAVCITNNTGTPYHINPYDRIGQLVIVPMYCVTNLIEVDEFPNKERGDNGFGSTGK